MTSAVSPWPWPARKKAVVTKRDPLLWIIPLMLSSLGVVVILSLTSVRLTDGTLSFTMGRRQAQWLVVAWTAMALTTAVPLRFWRDRSGSALILSWIMSWLPLIPGVGVGGGGALRWLRIGSITVQPLELLALCLTIHLCKIYSRGEMKPMRAFCLTLILVSVMALPILLQPDLGGVVLLFVLAMGIYVSSYGFLLPICAGVLLSPFFYFVMQKGYRQRRILSWLDPWSDPADTGYQAIQGFIAFANGGLWGTGLGKAVQRSRFLPAAHTDYIFAAISETLGIWGSIGVLLLFLFLFIRIYAYFVKITDPWISTLLWGLALSWAVPLCINIGGITNIIPMTGMPLPFISYGGSALVVSWVKVGILFKAIGEWEAVR